MLYLIRFFLSFLTIYFFGRIIFLLFCNPKEKHNIISKFHSFFLGLGFTSITFWFYTIATNGYNSNYHIIESCSVAVIYLYLRLKKEKCLYAQLPNESSQNVVSGEKKRSLINYLSVIVFSLIAVYSCFKCIKYPDGSWDALGMWNYKAKFLAHGNEVWNSIFFKTYDSYDYLHRDYPLFLPCTIARVYNYVGERDYIIPLFFSWFFTFISFVLPYFYLKKLKNKYYSLFAVCVLSFSPTIFFYGCMQYADMPLTLFILISLYEYIIWNRENKNLPWIGMFFAALCFWVKNEGIPWFISYTLLVIYCLYKKEKKFKSSIKEFFKVVVALLPIFISVLFVRYFANSENDLVFGLSDRLKQIFEIERYKLMFPYVWEFFIKQHFWILFIPIYLFAGFIDKKYSNYKYLLLIISLMYLIFIFVYLTTPHNLKWHLETSFTRIFSDYLHSLIFLGCLLFDIKRNNQE